MKTSRVTVFFVAVLLTGCAHRDPVVTTFDPPFPERNSANEPIVAVFFGRIPCALAACEKRKVELVLYGRDQGQVPTTYWLGQIGVGVSNERAVTTGSWAIRRGVQGYPDAVVYALDSAADESLQYTWRVSNEVLLVLDKSMSPRSGNGAWGYMLIGLPSPTLAAWSVADYLARLLMPAAIMSIANTCTGLLATPKSVFRCGPPNATPISRRGLAMNPSNSPLVPITHVPPSPVV